MRDVDPFEDLMRSLEETLRRGEPQQPPPPVSGDRPAPPPPNPPNLRRWLWIGIPLLILFLGSRLIGAVATWTWMDSVSYDTVFWTRVLTMAALFLGGTLLFYLIFAINVVIARQIAPFGLSETPLQQVLQAFGMRVTPVVMVAGGLAGIVMGLAAMGQWEHVLLYLNQGAFGVTDPAFGRDVGFYVFTLPIWEAVRAWLLVALAVSFVAVLLVSGILWQGWSRSRGIVIHLALLAALMLMLAAWQYQIATLNLVFSERGATYGAGYTDLRAVRPTNTIMIFVSIAAAASLVALAVLRRGPGWLLTVLAAWFGIGLLVTGVYPGFVQRFQVGPNELTLETPYIEANIEATRRAFALDEIDVQSYDARQRLTAQAILAEPDTILNIRLWDYKPLLQTYNQVQALRQYYEFNDIDIDRYLIDGRRRQVMLAARELIPSRLSQEAQTWVNQRLVYTHGFGVAASPVAQVTRDGLPTFYLQDLPPTGVITVTQPQIYFGERTDDYVIGRTEMPEFDYPRADGNVTSSFSAQTGIPMNWWNRILFAIHLGDLNLVLNSDITPDSRLLWHRDVAERLNLIAPFLQYDSDPYVVVSDDGRIYWMQDAYTTTNRYPYSQPLGSLNYIRNAVKVVTSAYDGTITFYIADPADPLIRAYASIYPTLFQPMEAMPADLLDNVRYPEDLFTVQAELFRTYHTTDAIELYNREDIWAWPEEIADNQTVRVEPYYVLMQLPGSTDLDYVLILPFTPSSRENMVAWLAAQNDPGKYGEKVVYTFGKDSLFFGPKQIEARIDQDPVISQQLTLWNQQGSGVLRGNVLILPIGDSLLYVEPLYLQAASGRIPELTRVIAATADDVVMGETLGDALAALFGGEVARAPDLAEIRDAVGAAAASEASGGEGTGAGEAIVTVDALIVRANQVFEDAQTRLRAGDWAGYGDSIAELERLLGDLAAAEGVDLPDDAGAEDAAPEAAETEAAETPAAP